MPQAAETLRLTADASAVLRRVCSAGHKSPIYLVGGAIRDFLLGRDAYDLDLATVGARSLAKQLSSAFGVKLIVLDEENAVFRLVLPDAGSVRQLDLAELQGGAIATDLARRDFTINAVASLLDRGAPGRLIDPRGGLADLKKKVLRCESDEPFKSDPLRLLRAFRLCAELGFEIERQTLGFIAGVRHRVAKPAAERVQSELMLLLTRPGCSKQLKAMDGCGLLTALFPDLEPARQCALVYYGPGGVLTHSLDTAARADYLLSNLRRVYPGLAERIESRMPPRAVLLLAALLHDVAKAETAKQVAGRLRFFGHDTVGAKRAGEILKKLKFPRAHIETVSAVIAQHLRPGNLASADGVSDKAAYRFYRDLGEHALSLLLVCWADHASYLPEARVIKLLKLASEPPGTGLSRVKPADAGKTVHHLQVVSFLLGRLFDEPEKSAPERLLDGNEVMKTLGLPPGPEIGKWLERLREAQATGSVKTRPEALAFLKKSKK
ncbi:MAG: CCA tRNA nucleotidyltransferase [Elusimicrobia bacterium]|nr:CCA tRNA nucleotidyltransferase [Elusimicrobiota bacterium]